MTFTTAELTCMQTAQENSMQCEGYIQTYSRTFNSYGEAAETWTESPTATACGVDMRPGSERHTVQNTVTEYDATLRLAHDTVIDVKDRFRLTSMFGTALTTPIVYSIYAPIQRGPSAVRLFVKRIET